MCLAVGGLFLAAERGLVLVVVRVLGGEGGHKKLAGSEVACDDGPVALEEHVVAHGLHALQRNVHGVDEPGGNLAREMRIRVVLVVQVRKHQPFHERPHAGGFARIIHRRPQQQGVRLPHLLQHGRQVVLQRAHADFLAPLALARETARAPLELQRVQMNQFRLRPSLGRPVQGALQHGHGIPFGFAGGAVEGEEFHGRVLWLNVKYVYAIQVYLLELKMIILKFEIIVRKELTIRVGDISLTQPLVNHQGDAL